MNAPAKLFQIFRAGRHVAMNGTALDFSADEVALIAASYNRERLSAPLVLGHPADNAPAFGETTKLLAKEGTLYALANVGNSLASMVRAGRYRYVSASFFPPRHPDNPAPGAYYLRHIGFLGAHPPAVKGLTPPSFAEFSDGYVSFADCPIDSAEETPAFVAPAGYGVTPDRLALHRAALSYQQACPALSYAEAASLAESGVITFTT